jgi:hypothetical protein
MYFSDSQMFRRNKSPVSSGSKSKQSMKSAETGCTLKLFVHNSVRIDGMEVQGIGVQYPAVSRDISFLHSVHTGPAFHAASCTLKRGYAFSGHKIAGA